jgi:hypothetical protein
VLHGVVGTVFGIIHRPGVGIGQGAGQSIMERRTTQMVVLRQQVQAQEGELERQQDREQLTEPPPAGQVLPQVVSRAGHVFLQ